MRSLFASLLALVALATASCSHADPPSHPTPAPSARPVTLTYLGVAGWSLSSQAGTLLVDPYVTRAPVDDEAAPLVPDETAIAAHVPKAVDAILVGHSHYDHALDVPTIARRTGAWVVGTDSTKHLALAGGVAEGRVRVARGGETFELGPFSVRAVRALHSLTGQPDVPIPAGVRLPLAARDYGQGGTLQYLVRFEGRSIHFVGTANFVEAELTGLSPDVAVIAVGLRSKIPDYTCRLLRALGQPAVVMPNHFDAFQEPLRPGHMEPDEGTRQDLDDFAREVARCSPRTRVEVPVHLRPIPI